MLTGLYSAATGITAAEQQQEFIAQNLANINMPGYRRVRLGMLTANLEFGQGGEPPVNGAHHQGSVDFTPGLLQTTGRSLDVALDGDGFLVLDAPQGPIYTRDGVMQIDERGRLTNNAGIPYAGVQGIPPNISPAQIRIAQDGSVFAAGQPVGRLEVVRFEDNQRLNPIGLTTFTAPEDLPAESANDVNVQQGARELSNVNATDELVRMLIGMRYHEAAKKALNALSDSLHEHIQGGQ